MSNHNIHTTLPTTGFIRLATVLKIIPISKSTWWNGIKAGKFPKQIKLGNRISVWRVEDITTLVKTLYEKQL